MRVKSQEDHEGYECREGSRWLPDDFQMAELMCILATCTILSSRHMLDEALICFLAVVRNHVPLVVVCSQVGFMGHGQPSVVSCRESGSSS